MKKVLIVFLTFILPCILAIVSVNIIYNNESDFSMFQNIMNNIYNKDFEDIKVKELVDEEVARYIKTSESIYVPLSNFYIVDTSNYSNLDNIMSNISYSETDMQEKDIDLDYELNEEFDVGGEENIDGQDFLDIIVDSLVFQEIISNVKSGVYDIGCKIRNDEPYVNVNALVYKGDYYDLEIEGAVLRYFSSNLPITYTNYINQMSMHENLLEIVNVEKALFSTVFYVKDSFYDFSGKIVIEKDLFGKIKDVKLDLPFILRKMGNAIRIEG